MVRDGEPGCPLSLAKIEEAAAFISEICREYVARAAIGAYGQEPLYDVYAAPEHLKLGGICLARRL